jgi:hypothetical protein
MWLLALMVGDVVDHDRGGGLARSPTRDNRTTRDTFGHLISKTHVVIKDIIFVFFGFGPRFRLVMSLLSCTFPKKY